MADGPYLPEHIILHIFLRVPTKPLFQLKCLSKHYNHAISDPKFIKSRSRRMIFLPSLPFHALDNTAPPMIKLFSPFINQESCREITIVGSFNGIVLLVLEYSNKIIIDHNLYDHHMILYNPLSGEFNTVPHPQSYDRYSDYVYGFGYGTNANDLKIFKLKVNVQGGSRSFEVFGLKTWSWSRPSELIGDYRIYISYSGTFANGFLYWHAERGPCSGRLILALDIKNMVFSEIKIPDGCWFNPLGTYNGRLCMVCSQIDVEGYKLKVMNEHGFGESWSTVCSFGTSFTSLIRYASCMRLLCILDDGKLLMWTSSNQFIIYDMLRDSSMEVNALTSFSRAGNLQSVEYVESMISPLDICSASI